MKQQNKQASLDCFGRIAQMLLILVLSQACATLPPKSVDNVCQMFHEKSNWFAAAQAAQQRWGTPISLQMAFIHQESRFVADAEPPRPTLLGIIPWFRNSSAYGYSQAQDGTWSDYQKQTGEYWADRDDFADSCNFVAWYCSVSQRKLGISQQDAYHQYLAYHEGQGGYKRGSYRSKQWLLNIAQRVQQRMQRYEAQLKGCRPELENE